MDLRQYFLYIAYNVEGKKCSKFDILRKTLYGITKKYYPSYYKEIKRCIKEKDKEKLDRTIYLAYYDIYKSSYANLLYDDFPQLALTHFDMYFNAGKHSFEILQKIFKNYGVYSGAIDGIFGQKSSVAMLNFLQRYKDDISIKYKSYINYNYYRREFYLHNKQKVFRCGWCNRVQKIEKVLIPFE